MRMLVCIEPIYGCSCEGFFPVRDITITSHCSMKIAEANPYKLTQCLVLLKQLRVLGAGPTSCSMSFATATCLQKKIIIIKVPILMAYMTTGVVSGVFIKGENLQLLQHFWGPGKFRHLSGNLTWESSESGDGNLLLPT
ncbi:unnamed protein product [Ixodes pacificus]